MKIRAGQRKKLGSRIQSTEAMATMAEIITQYQFWFYSGSVICFFVILSRVGNDVFSLPYAAINFSVWSTICMLGVTLGYHRYFSHRSFQASKPLKISLAVAALLSWQGTIAHWVARHRLHHRYADSVLDPHSPFASNREGNCSNVATVRSFFWSHWVWQFKDRRIVDPSRNRCLVEIPTKTVGQHFEYAQELKADQKLRKLGVHPIHWYSRTVSGDKTISKLDMLYPVFVLASIVLPIALSSGLFFIGRVNNTSSQVAGTTLIESVLSGFFWGFLVRLIAVQELTNSINSIAHLLGYRNNNNETNQSRIAKNTPILGILNFGEGYHSNHHDEPSNPNFSRQWHEIDLAYQLLRFLCITKLAKLQNLKLTQQDISRNQSPQSSTEGVQ